MDVTGVVMNVTQGSMKKILMAVLMLSLTLGCEKDEATTADRPCGTYKSGQSLRTGPDGGCYYINSNGNKTYVEREACKC